MKSNNSIEINGKLYDAHTGRLLSGSEPVVVQSTPVAPPTHAKVTNRGHSIDGVHRVGKSKPHTMKTTPTTKSEQISHPAVHRTTPVPLHRHLRHSLTLNRRAVKTPHISVGEDLQSSAQSKTIQKKIDPSRLQRASRIAQSSAISRFGVRKHDVVPDHETKTTQEVSKKPNVSIARIETPATKMLLQQLESPTPLIEPDTPIPHGLSRTRLFSYGASGLIVLLLAGYVAYLNIPSLSMKVAASKAGFAATMPANRPAGYSLKGPVMSSPGLVTINFGSNSDDRHFSLKQEPTTWDSQALLENYVVAKDSNYTTFQDSGLTVYIFNGSNAAWVSGGKFYELDGTNSKLDSDQMLSIATSM